MENTQNADEQNKITVVEQINLYKSMQTEDRIIYSPTKFMAVKIQEMKKLEVTIFKCLL